MTHMPIDGEPAGGPFTVVTEHPVSLAIVRSEWRASNWACSQPGSYSCGYVQAAWTPFDASRATVACTTASSRATTVGDFG